MRLRKLTISANEATKSALSKHFAIMVQCKRQFASLTVKIERQ